MISAEEARELSAKNSGIAEELKKIDSEIRKAAMHGKTKVVYEPDVQLCKALFLQLAEPLYALGFSVAWFNNLNKLLIRW
jgi:hypothetical protein